MNLPKRGLGRGLEALLADVSGSGKSKKISPADIKELDGQALQTVYENIQMEKLALLKEAEALKTLIAEFESIIRADLS